MLETFLNTLHEAGFRRVLSNPGGRQYTLEPRYACKGSPAQRLDGYRVRTEYTEIQFNGEQFLETLDPL